MRWVTLVILLFAVSVGAEEKINEKYSYKDFMGGSLRNVKVEELNNTVIVGSCFYREGVPNCKVFPDDMVGVTFRSCNLDNVFVPLGNIVEKSCCHRNIKDQNDWEDWILDKDLKPIEPMNKKQRFEVGVSIDPKDIPIIKLTKEEVKIFQETLNADITP